MPREDDDIDLDLNEDLIDDEPLPVKRDTRIFSRKQGKEKNDAPKKDEDFEEDVFV